MRTIIIITLIAFAQIAFAGDRAGNGGDVVYCQDSAGNFDSIQLLDHFEAEYLRGWQLDMGPAHLNVEGKVDHVIKLVENLAPVRGLKFRKDFEAFVKEARYVDDAKLPNIDDSKHVIIPEGCEIKQIAVQTTEPDLWGGIRYLIDKELWNLLDDFGKAGLMLHEIVYKEAIELGHSNSINTRYVNSFISSTEMKGLGVDEFLDILSNRDFPAHPSAKDPNLHLINKQYNRETNALEYAEIGKTSYINIENQIVELTVGRTIEFDPAGNIIYIGSAKFKDIYSIVVERFGSKFIVPRDEYLDLLPGNVLRGFPFVGNVPFDFNGAKFVVKEHMLLHSVDIPHSLMLAEPALWPLDKRYDIGVNQLLLAAYDGPARIGPQIFHENGSIAIANLAKNHDLKVFGQDVDVSRVKFYPSGSVDEVNFDNSATYKYFDGDIEFIKKMKFDEKGNALAGYVAPGQRLKIAGMDIPLAPGGTLNVYDHDRETIDFYMAGERSFSTFSGKVKCPDRSMVFLYIDGQFRYCSDMGVNQVKVLGQTVLVDQIKIRSNGNIMNLRLKGEFPFELHGQRFRTDGSMLMFFHANGQIEGAKLTEEALLKKADGSLVLVPANNEVWFDDLGYLKYFVD